MLLRHHPPGIDTAPATLSPGLEHLDQGWVAVLRWLNANKVDYVLVGPVAHAIRGELTSRGPVAIVLAPYDRNYERLTVALVAQDAGLRSTHSGAGDRGLRGTDPTVEVKLSADKLARGRRWLLRFSGYDLDVEGPGVMRAGDGVRYQELLYEASRFEVCAGVSVEVASPEDLEHFSHVRRTGVAPEFRVTRTGSAPVGEASAAPPRGNSADA